MSADNIVRGQSRGYRDEPGVAGNSYMATYAALRLYVDSWRWDGVPFYVRAGKCLKMTCTEVTVKLRNAPQVVFSEATPSVGNYVRFRLSPQVAIAFGPRAKRPGAGMMASRWSCPSWSSPNRARTAGWATTSVCSATPWRATPRCSRARRW